MSNPQKTEPELTGQAFAQQLIPFAVFAIIIQKLSDEGYEVRKDIDICMERILTRDLPALNLEKRLQYKELVFDESLKVLQTTNSNAETLLVSFCAFIVRASREGITFTENVLDMTNRIISDHVEYHGETIKGKVARETAAKLENEFHRNGWFLFGQTIH